MILTQNNILDLINWLLIYTEETYKDVFIPDAVKTSIKRLKNMDSSGVNAIVHDLEERERVLKIVNPNLYNIWINSTKDLEHQIRLKTLHGIKEFLYENYLPPY